MTAFKAGLGARLFYLGWGLVALLLMGACMGGDRFAPQAGWSGVAVAGEMVYVGSMEGQILALDAETNTVTNTVVWAFPQDEDEVQETFGAIYGTPTVADGKVYVGGYNGKVYAVDAAKGGVDSGGQQWEFEVDGRTGIKGVIGSIVVADGKAVFGAGEDSESGRLYVLSAKDLTEKCRYPPRGQEPIGKVWSTPVVANGVAYFGDLGHRFHAVALKDCTLRWPVPTELGGAIASTPLVVRGQVYVGSYDRSFYAIDIATGAPRQLFTADSWFWSGVATDGRRLYVPNMDGKLYAIDLAGNQVWEPFDTGGAVLSTPVLVDGRIVVASDAKKLFVLRAKDGQEDEVWRGGFSIKADGGEEAKVRAPLGVRGSVVYMSTLDHTVLAIDVDGRRRGNLWEHKTD